MESKRRTRWDWCYPVALLLFATIYYSSYALSGLDLQGEGGTIAEVSRRILAGERPIVDVFLGYNILWFLPIIGLFKWFGLNFLLVRIYFFVLCTVTGLLAFRLTRRMTHKPWAALVVALIVLMIPGMQYRNYMGLLGVANTLFILEAFVFEHRSGRNRILWLIAAIVVLSTTFLIRIDVGFFFLVLALGGALLQLIQFYRPLRERLRILGLTLVFVPLTFAMVHLPADLYARAHGFEEAFWQQYSGSISYMTEHLRDLVVHETPTANPSNPSAPSLSNVARNTRPLPPLQQLFSRTGKKRELAFLIYWPPVGSVIILGIALVMGIRGFHRRNKEMLVQATGLLIGLGGALTLFPQYFLFRPDPPHLSEMMCTYLAVSVAVCILLVETVRSRRGIVRWIAVTALFLGLFHLYIYTRYGLRSPWMGSIALRKSGAVFVGAENGVSGYLPSHQAEECKQLIQAIVTHSKPGDYMVCYPYDPMTYFMTNRRSFLYNLYVDNSTRPINFDQTAIEDLKKYQPTIVVIDDQPMNLTESSKFSVWAATTLNYIKTHYQFVTHVYGVDVYSHK